MVEKLQDYAFRVTSDISFELSDWDKVLENTSGPTVYHLKSSVDYYTAYFRGINLSLVMYENSKAVGIFPMFFYQIGDDWLLSSNGEGLLKPLFIDNIAKKTQKRLESKLVEIIYLFANKLSIKEVRIFESNTMLSSWYILWLQQAKCSFLSYQLSIDLNYSIDTIRSAFRKSYRPLVSKAFNEFDITVCENNIDDVFDAFKLLHFKIAGRETRNKESWDIQKQQIKNGEAFLVTVMDGDSLIGAGLFNYSKDMGCYSVGVYRRDMFDKPISHGVQMKAIETLKEKGCKTYLLGKKMTSIDENIPTEKELSITKFKEGFAGYVFAQPYLKVIFHE